MAIRKHKIQKVTQEIEIKEKYMNYVYGNHW